MQKVQKVQSKKNDIRIVRILRNLTFLSANFYTSGIPCRTMDDGRRKRGVSYPPYMADAKEETPRQRKGKIVITCSRDWVITKVSDISDERNEASGANAPCQRRNLKLVWGQNRHR